MIVQFVESNEPLFWESGSGHNSSWRSSNILWSSRISKVTYLTSTHALLCWRGLRKKVPSMSGYRSNTSMGTLQSTQGTLEMCWLASVDRMKQRVSSFPWLPSSSICNRKTGLLRRRTTCPGGKWRYWSTSPLKFLDQILYDEVNVDW